MARFSGEPRHGSLYIALTYTRESAPKTVTAGEVFFAVTSSMNHLDPQVSETTQLLLAWASGDQQALDALTPRVYRELRRTAANFMKGERQGHTLQATALAGVYCEHLSSAPTRLPKFFPANQIACPGSIRFCITLYKTFL
jgi:hypothetical protein